MKWFSFMFNEWIVSSVVFGITLLLALCVFLFHKQKREGVITPGRILFMGTFISAVVYFFPWYSLQLTSFQAFLNSVQHAFRLFSFDGDFVEKVAGFAHYPNEDIKNFYISFGSVLYTFAPFLTLGFILSFFKNFFAHLRYFICFWTNTHVFSELNEKTLALAISINKKEKPFLGFIPRNLIVFTDIVDRKEEQNLELIDKAKDIRAILFRKDLESIHLKRSWSLRNVNFYLISEDESEKIRHAENIMDYYDFKRVELHVFSDDVRTELLMTTKETENIKVVRVNDIQSLIYDHLDKNGIHLFQRSRYIENEGNVISAVIIGLGKYGQEMLKALAWYCQLEGYKLKINAFDADKKALKKFKQLCPELLDDKHNKNKIDGEPYYEIDIHSGIDVAVPDFENKLKEITDATYIFVCLGDDETNLNIATKIRAICERIDYIGDGRKPDIETVIYDSNVKEHMGIKWEDIKYQEEYLKNPENKKKPHYGATNFKKQHYRILMIGDLENFYSYDTIIKSELVYAGLSIHNGYCIEYRKVCFTENQMMAEWNQFIAENGLTESWEAHLSAWKQKNNKNDTFELSDAKSKFSFMTLKEEKEAENEDIILKIKNTATNRIDAWEKEVYSKFKVLMEDPEVEATWLQFKKDEISSAEKTFLFEYNHRSSIAKAIHMRLRKKLNFRQEITNKPWEDLTLPEKVELGKIEHIRWNAYMRTEGYSFSPCRNDLGKVHHNLVPVSKLSNDDLRKDA